MSGQEVKAEIRRIKKSLIEKPTNLFTVRDIAFLISLKLSLDSLTNKERLLELRLLEMEVEIREGIIRT